MAGALLLSVPNIAEVFLALADHPDLVGRSRGSLLEQAQSACSSARGSAARNIICRPRAALLQGRLAALRGHPRIARACYRNAISHAQRLGMPLEEALGHLALSGAAADETRRRDHWRVAGDIAKRTGAAWLPWFGAPNAFGTGQVRKTAVPELSATPSQV